MTWEDYGLELEDNLQDLHVPGSTAGATGRPSRRVFIPKPMGGKDRSGSRRSRTRSSSGQAEVLNTIYEADFLGFCMGSG